MAPPPPSTATVSQPVIDSAASAARPPGSATQPIAVVSERLPWRHTFISLRVPNFRIFALGHFVAVIALWMQRISQDWLVLQLSGSVTAVGITVALQFMPSLVLGPWGGMMADRFPKRKILVLCQSVAAVLAAALAFLALSQRITSTPSRWRWGLSRSWTSRHGRYSSMSSWAPPTCATRSA